MTTPKQPATEARRARIAQRLADLMAERGFAVPDRVEQWTAPYEDAAAILEKLWPAIEAEAAAGMSEQHSDIVALREALTEAAKMRHEYGKGIASGHDVTWETCFVPICAKYRELLRDTAPAAAEIEALPLMQAVVDAAAACSDSFLDRYTIPPKADTERLAAALRRYREQPATEEWGVGESIYPRREQPATEEAGE